MSWAMLALQIAKVVAPLAKAGIYYKANKQEKALQAYTEGQARQMATGHGMTGLQRDVLASEFAGQQAAAQQQALADVSRGAQGDAAQSGMAGQMRQQVYQQGQQGQAQAQTALAKADAAAQKQAQQDYVQNLMTLSQMEYQRRQKAMGETEKMSQQDVADAFSSGQSMRAQMGETGQAGAAAGQTGVAEGMSAATTAV